MKQQTSNITGAAGTVGSVWGEWTVDELDVFNGDGDEAGASRDVSHSNRQQQGYENLCFVSIFQFLIFNLYF